MINKKRKKSFLNCITFAAEPIKISQFNLKELPRIQGHYGILIPYL